MKQVLSFLLVALVIVSPVYGNDSIRRAETDTVKFTPQQLIVPGALVAVGALGVAVPPFVQARKWINKEIGRHEIVPVDDYLQYAPLVGYMFLDFAGVKSRRPFVDRVIVGATATILTVGLTHGIKWCVNEQRPHSERMNSFPSGHSAMAFVGAELLRQDYGPWVGAAGYLAATAVGVMRIVRGYHWLNDVVASAGIGILCARAGEWLLPFNRRWLGLDRKRGEAAVLVPTYSPFDGSVNLSFAMTF